MLKKYLKEKKNLSQNDQNKYLNNVLLNKLVDDTKAFAGTDVDDTVWELVKGYREKRNQLYHLNPDLTVPDSTIKQFRDILVNLFKVFFNIEVGK
jgi:transcriptional accessory protein Tex/SPT6